MVASERPAGLAPGDHGILWIIMVRPKRQKRAPLRKVTEMEGVYASCEVDGGLVFEPFPDWRAHTEAGKRHRWSQKWFDQVMDRTTSGHGLLPEPYLDRKGRWRIVVEFWPDDDE